MDGRGHFWGRGGRGNALERNEERGLRLAFMLFLLRLDMESAHASLF